MVNDARDPVVTVVVCSLNGQRTIRACLESLAAQSIADAVQMVVIDDGSSDHTAEIARAYTPEVIVHGSNAGLSAARNTGIERARAPIVAFTDDDCIPDPFWLERLVRAHQRPGIIGVGGVVEVASVTTLVHRYLEDWPPLAPLELELDQHRSLAGRLLLYLRRQWQPGQDLTPRPVYSFPGANMSFKRSALVTVGGFDPKMRFGSDDEYICAKMRERFATSALWFEPDALVRHDYEGTIRDLRRRSHAYGRGHGRAFLDDPERRWPIVFPLPLGLAAIALTARDARVRLLLPLLVEIFYPQGPLSALRHRRASNLAFSWLRLAEEEAHNLGMLEAILDQVRAAWWTR